MSRRALNAFLASHFDEAQSELVKLETDWSHSAQLANSIAILDYLRSSGRNQLALRAALERIRSTSDPDPALAVVSYNIAVINYQEGNFSAACEDLETLFASVDSLDNALAARLCFLLVDCLLELNRPDRAALVVTFLERTFVSDHPVGRLPEFGVRLHFCRARLHLLAKLPKESKKEIRASLTPAPPPGSPEATLGVFMKANMEFLRGNHRKALKLLSLCDAVGDGTSDELAPVPTGHVDPLYYKASTAETSASGATGEAKPVGDVDDNDEDELGGSHDGGPAVPTDAGVRAMYFNNVGVVLVSMGKHQAASHYFATALKESARAKKHNPSSHDHGSSVARNLGLHLLVNGQPLLAFRALHQAGRRYHTSALLWLRLAEACLGCHLQGLADARPRSIVASAGRVLLPTSHSLSAGALAISNDVWLESVVEPSLEYASVCLCNAIALADESQHDITVAAMLGRSYVALNMDDPVVALHTSRQLLALTPKPSNAHCALASMYAGEALHNMGRWSEALHSVESSSTSIPSPWPSPYASLGSPSQPVGADMRLVSWVNAGASLAAQGEFDKAIGMAQQALSVEPGYVPAVLLTAYVELRRGSSEKALAMVTGIA